MCVYNAARYIHSCKRVYYVISVCTAIHAIYIVISMCTPLLEPAALGVAAVPERLRFFDWKSFTIFVLDLMWNC